MHALVPMLSVYDECSRYTAPIFSARIASWMHGGCYDRSWKQSKDRVLEQLKVLMIEKLLDRLMELQFMSWGRDQFSFSFWSSLIHELIHDTVRLSLCRTLHLKSDDWTLHALLGKTWIRMKNQLTTSWLMTHTIERYRWCSRIDACYLNSTMWLLSLSYDSHHLLDSLRHAFDQWCILCMLSNYDDVVGGRSDRLSASLSESLQLVATWCKMVTMIVMVMGVIMLAMVAIMLVVLTPFAIDLFIIVLLNMSMYCMRDITTTAGSSRSQDCGTTGTGWHKADRYAHDHSSCIAQLS